MALVAFLAVDAVLVGLALTSSREVDSDTPYIQPTQPPQPSATPTPTTPPVVALPVRRVLAAAGESAVWRAEGGSCTGGVAPLLQTSSDAGATWKDRDLARYDVRQVLALWIRDVNYGEAVVRLGDGCTLAGMRSFTAGQFWEQQDSIIGGHSFLDPDAPGAVHIDGADVPAPCGDAIQAVSGADTVVALCGSGAAFAWSSGSWMPYPPQTSAIAIVGEAPSPEFVLVGAADCLLGLGKRVDEQQLVPRLCSLSPAVPGQSVATWAASRTWLWAGNWFGVL
ncbi:hypothetical protein [Protaetiibacter intestinalis]|uniref:hypothetical protein n=1 Tax=Protaetiibacter intestinalis TaxID=2419774 RepID=UPI0013003103|nr:hypothetical protein [Protaetiibacter intestinalis]